MDHGHGPAAAQRFREVELLGSGVRRHGAQAFGQPDLGRLAPGLKADVVLVDLDSPRMQPVLSVPSALVYNANGGDVDTVIVDGRILMQNKRVTCLDERALLEECRQAARRLLERAGVTRP